jgi:hypothetical protein
LCSGKLTAVLILIPVPAGGLISSSLSPEILVHLAVTVLIIADSVTPHFELTTFCQRLISEPEREYTNLEFGLQEQRHQLPAREMHVVR